MSKATIKGKDLPISTKQSVEICRLLRNKSLENAKDTLNEVIKKKRAVPYLRYKKNIPHKKGRIAAGRFPIKASKEILNLLNGVEANARNLGLNTNNLIIKHICANKVGNQFHLGRQRGIKMKRTHIDIIVEEKISKERNEEKK